MTVEPHEAMARLADLGSSQAIAEFLRAQRVAGHRYYGSSCPVATYLKREAGWRVEVRTTTWSLRARNLPEGMVRRRRTPRPVAEFVLDFDQGRYPDLARARPEDVAPAGRVVAGP